MFWPLILLVVVVPFGAAVQAVGSGATLVSWLPALRRGLRDAPRALIGATVAALLSILSLLLATSLNEMNPARDLLGFFIGHLTWIALPLLGVLSLKSLSLERQTRLFKIIGVMLLLWGAVVCSQSFLGWRIVGDSLASSDLRPRGFYSHPLSLAYALLWFWPAALDAALRPARRPLGIAVGITLALMLYWTESRTVQLTALMLLLWNLATRLSGKARLMACAAFVLGLGVTFATENRISRKFLATFSEQGEDRKSAYPDDRVAFWHAHALMIAERPLLGHGINLNYTYRAPYYEKIGLGDFPKKYEAHNTYIQLLAEGGVVGFLCFMVWWGFIVGRIRRLENPEYARIAWQTLGVMAVAAMTQNTFQDFEVRTVLTMGAVVLWLLPVREREMS